MEEYGQTNSPEKPPKRKFWQNLLIMDNSDLKRLLSLSSLMLSFAILIIYIISYILLMPLLDRVFGDGPVWLSTLAESLIPALVGTGAVMLTWPLFRDKRVLPSAYLWLTLFALILGIAVLVSLKGDPSARTSFLYTFAWDVLPSLIIGNLAAWSKYRKFIDMK